MIKELFLVSLQLNKNSIYKRICLISLNVLLLLLRFRMQTDRFILTPCGVYVPSDIYARYLRLKGEEVLFIGGSDEHGIPITIKATQGGLLLRYCG